MPEPTLPARADVATLAAYGSHLLQVLAEPAPLQAGAEGEGLVAALARIALALQASDPARLRRQESWWGRLLGRDVERQAQAQGLQAQLGVLALQAREQAQGLAQRVQQRARAIIDNDAAAAALEVWATFGAAQLATLQGAAQVALAPRVDHLQRLATLRRIESGQWRLLQEQDEALLQRFVRIHDVLLPAWRQAALARQALAQAAQAEQAATLQAQIDDEVAAAQARLP
ncbi:cell division protein FtsY [Stenotrophomonas maltophilia 5BA-I-2]|nr:cell division protein FtsY [Stenotrophomonas maltophilia 5BA-I-2]